MENTEHCIQLDDILAAQARLGDNVLKTPCLHNERLSQALGCQVYFKAENLQHIGAFKARGALNAVLALEEARASCGVVTHSSGNHAAAIARAAGIRGIKAHVVMPGNSAATKIEAVRRLGVEPVFCEPHSDSREQTAEQIRQETGATLVHPFDNPSVMAGQGTVGLEILQQVSQVDAVIAPIGGGGLLSGVAKAIKSKCPHIKIFGAEPEWADDAYRSLQSGKRESVQRVDTVADGLRTGVGQKTFPIIQSLVEGILLASESEILSAMRQVTECAKLVVEPSAAVAMAALKRHIERFQGQHVVLIMTGGNVDFGSCRLGQE